MKHIIPLAILFTACNGTHEAPPPQAVSGVEIHDELKWLYDSAHVTGSFIAHDLYTDRWYFIDSTLADSATLPASSFKIFSSLYGLESGVVKDADHVFHWDGTDHGRPQVNKDLTLRESIRLSAYWVHRDIARAAGADVLKHWLDTVGYGNADTSGGFDGCWVRGNLRITPKQQVDLLARLVKHELPFSDRTVGIVEEITLQDDTLTPRVHGKTGWAMGSAGSTGWFVGWVEATDSTGPVVFANRVQTPDTLSETFAPARKAISLEVLERMGVVR